MYIPIPSPAAYELGFEMAQAESVPDLFQSYFMNAVHALMAGFDDDAAMVTDMVMMRPHHEVALGHASGQPDRKEQLIRAGYGLLVLATNRQPLVRRLRPLANNSWIKVAGRVGDVQVNAHPNALTVKILDRVGVQFRQGIEISTLFRGYTVVAGNPRRPNSQLPEAEVQTIHSLLSSVGGREKDLLTPMVAINSQQAHSIEYDFIQAAHLLDRAGATGNSQVLSAPV